MSRIVRGLVAALISGALVATASPALAKPPAKPGAPSNLVIGDITKTGSTFNVPATWSAAPRATRYVARLSANGVTLDTASVTTLDWVGHTTAPDGTLVTVTITAYNVNRKGGATSKSVALPDVTKPVASYSVTHDPAPSGPNVTLTADALSDNVTPTLSLVQTVDWGDGSPTSPWNPASTTITHAYADVEARYEASVTVTDQANNTLVVPLVIVVKDATAPTGSFALDTGTAWAKYTKVSVTQAAIHDNLSPDDKIARLVSWGDGSQTVWAAGTVATHVYATGGSFSPTVVLTDEAGNSSAALPTSTVVVTVDSVAPVTKVTVPTVKPHSVRSWKTIKGTLTDSGVGPRNVVLRAIEKRGTTWFAYKASTRTWVKAATKGKAWAKTVAASAKPSASGAWSIKLTNLKKGKLLLRVRGYDKVGNASALVSKRASLTKR